MARDGHGVAVIAANPSYPHWRLFDGYSAWRWSRRNEDGVDTHRCPVFIPSRVSGGTRILHYASFAERAAAAALEPAYPAHHDPVLLAPTTLVPSPLATITDRLTGAETGMHVPGFDIRERSAQGKNRKHS